MSEMGRIDGWVCGGLMEGRKRERKRGWMNRSSGRKAGSREEGRKKN